MWSKALIRPRGFRRILIAGAASSLLAGAIVNQLSARPLQSCDPVVEGSITESQLFTPYEAMRSHVAVLPLNPNGLAPAALAADVASLATLDGRTVRWAVAMDDGDVTRYFFDKPISVSLTPEDFWAQGGVQLERHPYTGVPFYTILLAEFRERAVPVKVGALDGAMTWADPAANGVRTHNVYWSDDQYNYALVADRSAAAAVTLARVVACQ